MIPTISMSVWRRPEYTKMVLDALAKNAGAGKYRLVVAVDREGDRLNPEVMHIVKQQTWPASLEIIPMIVHAGCNRTVFTALNAAFSESDYVIHIEDDVLPANDTLAWFEWAGRTYRDDPSIFTVTAWRHAGGWLPELGRPKMPDEHRLASRESFFTCWGWATWIDRWREILPRWTDKDDHALSWDVRMSELRGGRAQIAPLISRAVNIGAMLGTHRGHHPLSHWKSNGSDIVSEFTEIAPPY